MAQLFLVSSSKYQDGEFFDHCKDDLQNFLQPQKNTKVLFVPYALKDHDWYASIIRPVFKEIGCQLVGIHEVNNPRDAVEDCDEYEVVFVGGGNTFRLLQKLHETGIFFNLKRAVKKGP